MLSTYKLSTKGMNKLSMKKTTNKISDVHVFFINNPNFAFSLEFFNIFGKIRFQVIQGVVYFF